MTVGPLTLQVINESRFVMTVNAGHVFMRGTLPRVDIDRHIVTDTAEEGSLRYFIGCRKEYKDSQKDEHGKKDPSLVSNMRREERMQGVEQGFFCPLKASGLTSFSVAHGPR